MEEELQKFRVQWKEAIHNRQACLQGDAEVDKQEVVGGDSPHGEPNDIHDTSDTVPNSKRFQTENTASEATAKLFSIDISVKNSTQPPGSNQRLQKYFKDEEDDKESPEGGDERGVSFHPRPGHREEVPPLAKQRKESFVDKLIEDLDDTNTVPFFDVELPKEITIKIFGHLNATDLGRCAQVSKSWKVLSEDNVLWSQLCHNSGYELDMDTSDHFNWKLIARRIVEQDRKVLQNWKERNCGLSESQPSASGILSTVDMHNSVIVAGYSSGDVCLWDLTVDSEPIVMSQPPGESAHSEPSCSTVRGNVVAVGTKGGFVKIFNSHGLSLEHELVCPKKEPVCHISSTMVDQSPFIAASFGMKKYMVIRGGHDNQWHSNVFPPTDAHDAPIEDIFIVGLCRERSPCGVVVCHRNKIALRTLDGACVDVVASSGLYSSVYFSNNQNTLLGRVDIREEDGHLAWGSGVKSHDVIKIYDYARGLIKHTISCKQRHVVTALNFGDSPPNMVVTGNTDYKVMVHDLRMPDSVAMVLKGHDDIITDVQMDDWKVTSGSKDGSSVVWDQRMCSLLWQSNARHPVKKCRFQGNYLLTANVPIVTNPDLLFTDDEWEPYSTNSRSIPNRFRGLLRVFDFSVDPLHYSKYLPSICSSAYNEPVASRYNLDLILPYDDIDDQDIM